MRISECGTIRVWFITGVAMVAAPMTLHAEPTTVQSTNNVAFNQADKNRDGFLSPAEIPEFLRLLSQSEKRKPVPQTTGGTNSEESSSADGFKKQSDDVIEEKLKKMEGTKGVVASYVSIHESFFTDLEGSFIAGEEQRKGIANPAKFTWTGVHGKKSTYQLDFAIQPSLRLIQKEPMALGGYPTAVGNVKAAIYPMFEAHVATEETESKNQLLYAVVGQLDVSHPQAHFWQADHIFILGSYETDRHSDIGQRRLDALWSPDWRIPGWGQHISLHDLNSIFPEGWLFYFRPFVGIECIWIDKGFDKFLAEAKLPTTNEDFGFLHAGMSTQIGFQDRFAVTASYNYRAELYGKPGTHGFFQLSGLVYLDSDKHLSAGLTYTRGEDSPIFADLNKVQAWIGVEF